MNTTNIKRETIEVSNTVRVRQQALGDWAVFVCEDDRWLLYGVYESREWALQMAPKH